MNPGGDPPAAKDAVFLSPHKFIGGPGTPGLLIVRRELLTNRVPDVVGGGTVAYVSPTEHTYLTDPEHREEGGTPAIIESIRAGLVFDLKRAVGTDVIRAHEEDLVHRASPRGRPIRRSACWATSTADRLSIVSFTVRGPSRALPAPQRDRRDAQRRVRHPGPRRVLLRRAVRAPAAGHRPGPLRGVRGADLEPAARGSSRGGSGSTSTTSSPRQVFTYLVRGRRPDRPPRLGAARGLPLRHRDRACGSTAPDRSSLRCAWPRCTTTPPVSSSARATTIVPTRAHSSSTWRRPARCWPRQSTGRTGPEAELPDELGHLQWFDLPAASLA